MTELLRTYVRGNPPPKGSVNAYPLPFGGVNVVHTPTAQGWEEVLKWFVKASTLHTGRKDLPAEGPVSVELDFRLQRGKTVRRELPHVKPDLDKLVRCVLDALTNAVYKDDAQVVRLLVAKRYAEAGQEPGVQIRVVEATRD